MRRPPRNPFHHSDLGGPFLAFAPKLPECDQDVTHGSLSDDHLPYSTRHQRSSVVSLLIDALRYRRHHPVARLNLVVLVRRLVRRSSKRRKREPGPVEP